MTGYAHTTSFRGSVSPVSSNQGALPRRGAIFPMPPPPPPKRLPSPGALVLLLPPFHPSSLQAFQPSSAASVHHGNFRSDVLRSRRLHIPFIRFMMLASSMASSKTLRNYLSLSTSPSKSGSRIPKTPQDLLRPPRWPPQRRYVHSQTRTTLGHCGSPWSVWECLGVSGSV